MRKAIVGKSVSVLLILSLIAVGAGFFGLGCSKEDKPEIPPVVDKPEILYSLNSSSWDPNALRSVESEAVVITKDDILRFNFRDANHPILGNHSFWSKYSGPPYSPQDKEDFGDFTFYIFPEVMIDQTAFEKSFEHKKTFHPKGYSGPPLYKIEFDIELSDEELRNEAINHLIENFAGANLKEQNVAIVPYGYFGVTAKSLLWDKDKSVYICSYPEEGYSLGPIPNKLRARFIGTQEALDILKDDASFHAQYLLPVQTPQEDSAKMHTYDMAKSDFRHFLTGKASWDLMVDHKSKTKVKTKNFLGVLNDGEGYGKSGSKTSIKSWVTRNQVREVALEASSGFEMVIWQETDSGPNFDNMIDQFIDFLLERSTTTREVNIDKGVLDLTDLEMDDIRPDILNDINAAIKKHSEMKNSGNIDTKAEGKKAGTGGSGETHFNETSDFITAEDINWDTTGKTIVPKSIDLHQFAESSFDDKFSIDLVHRKAAAKTKEYSAFVYLTHEGEKDVLVECGGIWSKSFDVGTSDYDAAKGKDADVHTAGGGQTKVTVTTTPKVEGSIIKLKIRIDIYEVKGDETHLWGETDETYDVLPKIIKETSIEELKGIENIEIEKVTLDYPEENAKSVKITGVNRVWVKRQFVGAEHIQEWAEVSIDTGKSDDRGKETGINGDINISYTATIKGTKKEKIYTTK
jgi:hypothetical protein